jgi:hypothetical protein
VDRRATCVPWLAITITIASCVNNYVVGDEGGSSSPSPTDDGTASTAMHDEVGTGCNDPVCPDSSSSSAVTTSDADPSVEGDGNDGSGDTGLPPTGRAPCDPCETDLHCGGEFDLCVDLGGPSPVCTQRCFEAPPCPEGATCEPVTSVDGQTADQCVPTAGCPDSGATGGSGGM